MNENKKRVQRRGALLLATILCISAMAGCGTATQQKATEKTTTQQSQQAKPKTDSSKKDTGKKDSGKKDDSKKNKLGKITGKQSAANKPAGTTAGTNKPAGTQAGTSKPAGTQAGTSKPAGTQAGTSKPAGTTAGTNKPAGAQAGTNKPSDKKEAPSIKTQPKSVKIAAGSPFKFTVSASGANLKYVWQVDKNDGKGWTDIPDANQSSYTVKNAGEEQNGWKFRCVVSNDAGKAESAAAVLNVTPSAKSK